MQLNEVLDRLNQALEAAWYVSHEALEMAIEDLAADVEMALEEE